MTSCRAWTTSAILIFFLFSETAFAITANNGLDVPAGLPAPGRAGKAHDIYSSLSTFEEQIAIAEAVQPEEPAQPAASVEPVPTLGAYLKESPGDLAGGTKRIFSRDNLPLALTGAGLAALALTVDHRVKDYFQDRKPLEHVENIGDKIGNGYAEVGVGLALLGTGELMNNKKMADTGYIILPALLVTGIATEGLKYAFGRKRPNRNNHMSFPGGHASMTSTMAASISEMYDWRPGIAIPLYALTAFVGASRLQANEHYLSDVLAGMTLGTLVGSSFAKYYKEKGKQNGTQIISLTPLVERDLKGGILSYNF